jgi:pimeloyl-ACP methyl ester carboxylesterase
VDQDDSVLPTRRRPVVDALTLTTSDGVRLSGLHRVRDRPIAVVVAHGFTNATHKPSTLAVIDGFARHFGVVAMDFRGHGRSSGRSTVGRDEVIDLAAAVRFARGAGYARVVVVGFSMGGSVALRHAAAGAEPPDAVISVSSPSRWYIRDTTPMRRVHWLLESPIGPVAGRAMGIRLGQPWDVVPESPLEVVGRIRAPLLIVHGTVDGYFPVSHAQLLHRNAAGSQLWIEPGMGHAESATTDALVERMSGWIERTVPTGPAETGTIDS